MNKYLVTSALPYANGKLHIGHIAGAYLPADIYVRFLRLNKQDVIYICGTDEHGAPISIRAEKEQKTPQAIVDFYHEQIKNSFLALNIDFDNFSGTARPEHHRLAQEFFLSLLANQRITSKYTSQLYCEKDQRFLPDRYVEGKCYHCSTNGARGDQCDTCGKLIDATLLITPICKICGNIPIIKETKHWFLDLPSYEAELKNWLKTKTQWKENVINFILSWIEEGLIERAITRDIDWGVPVPLLEADNKVLYVWFDAPIGYISSTIEWASQNKNPELWKDYWFDKNTKLIHFIGKDNIPFHSIIWPALLMGQDKDYILPYNIPANEYLTLEGEKISTSRNYAIWVDDFVQEFDSDLLRFVLAINAPESRDADFSWKEFQNQVNNALANVIGNLANRVFSFAKKHFAGELNFTANREFQTKIAPIIHEIHHAYSEFKVRKATKLSIDLAREGNKYFDESKPWVLVKENISQTEEILYTCVDLLRIISIILYPILPKSMIKLRRMMGLSEKNDTTLFWDEIKNNPRKIIIGDFTPLFKKIDDETINIHINLLKEKLQGTGK